MSVDCGDFFFFMHTNTILLKEEVSILQLNFDSIQLQKGKRETNVQQTQSCYNSLNKPAP